MRKMYWLWVFLASTNEFILKSRSEEEMSEFIDFRPNMTEGYIGDNFSLNISYSLPGSQPETKVYSFTDLDNPHIRSHSFFFHQKPSGLKYGEWLQPDNIKLTTGFREENNKNSYIPGLQVNDFDAVNGSKAYLTFIHKRQNKVIVAIRPFKVYRKPDVSSDLDRLKKRDMFKKKDKVELNYWMNKNFHLGNGDISSITMTTTSEASLEPVSVGSSFIKDGGLGCITHTWSKMENQTTEIFYKRLPYNKFNLCMQWVYRIKPGYNLPVNRPKKSVILVDVKYQRYEMGVIVNTRKSFRINIFISNVKHNGFSIRYKSTGYCMHTYTSDNYTYHEEEVEFFAFNPCSTFVHRYNSLMQDNGLYFDPENVVMTTQVQRNNIKFYNYDLQSIATDVYLDIYQPQMGSKEFRLIKVTSATKEFQGVYDEQFGIFRNSEPVNTGAEEEVISIQVIPAEETVGICMTGIKRSKCFVVEENSQEMFPMSSKLHSLLGYDSLKRTYYGKDVIGYFMKASNNYIEADYISQQQWDKVISGGNVTDAQTYLMDDLYIQNTRETFAMTSGKQFSVTYYGLYNEDTAKYVVNWVPQSTCHLKIGKRQGEKLSSCKQIISMCPNVKSGYFWIGGNSGSTEYEVFCEMETAQGGWLKIADHKENKTQGIDITPSITTDAATFFTSNFSTYLDSRDGLINLQSFMSFTQMRFRCYNFGLGSTMDISTLENERGNSFLSYLMNDAGRSPACYSYQSNSGNYDLTSQFCYLWKDEMWSYSGETNPTKLYKSLIVYKQNGWNFGNGLPITCGGYPILTEGQWQIFVR